MPAALTLDQKKERAEAAMQSAQQEQPKTEGRRKRVSFNGTTSKLAVNTEKLTEQGYHTHVVNDMDNRISGLLDRGYEFVLSHEVDGVSTNVISRNTDIGDKVRFLVGNQQSGDPLYAYLMKIKKEWFEEDQKIIQDRNDLIDESIRRGKNSDGFYTREGDIKIKT